VSECTSLSLFVHPPSRSDTLDSFTLQEFLKQELEDSKEGGATGDVMADLVAFRRKLRKERQQAKLAMGMYEESLATLRDEKEEALNQVRIWKAQMETLGELHEKNEQLRKKIDELTEKNREAGLEQLSLMRRKRQAMTDAVEQESQLLRRVQDLERDIGRLREERMLESQQSEVRERQLREEGTRLKEQSTRLQRELDAARLDLAKAQQRSKVEASKPASTGAAAAPSVAASSAAPAASAASAADAKAREEQERVVKQLEAKVAELLTAKHEAEMALSVARSEKAKLAR
jgi:DNA repair exonuclease SbcCD ATPase subunit